MIIIYLISYESFLIILRETTVERQKEERCSGTSITLEDVMAAILLIEKGLVTLESTKKSYEPQALKPWRQAVMDVKEVDEWVLTVEEATKEKKHIAGIVKEFYVEKG